MVKMTKIVAVCGAMLWIAGGSAWAHCQIPCGIYGDDARFTAMLEDVTTIKKSIKMINEESAKAKPNYNQLVRWVSNKETHADNVSQTVLTYFLAQRIKPDQKDYEKKLVALHSIITLSMKCKQNTDAAHADDLEKAIRTFHELYHH